MVTAAKQFSPVKAECEALHFGIPGKAGIVSAAGADTFPGLVESFFPSSGYNKLSSKNNLKHEKEHSICFRLL